MQTTTLPALAFSFRRAWRPALVALGLLLAGAVATRAAVPPAEGDPLRPFTLKTLDARAVNFAEVAHGRTAVLVVLRGWPGYQCPFCTTQVYEYVEHAAEFAERNIPVVMIYPGPAEQLQAHAADFLGDKRWPANFHFLLDPDFSFTNQYGLRWPGEGETAFPSTFVIDAHGRVRFAQVSHEHGDRVGAASLLRTLAAAHWYR